MRNKFLLFFYIILLKLLIRKKYKDTEWSEYQTLGLVNSNSLNKKNIIKFFNHTKLNKFNSALIKKIFEHSENFDVDINEERKPSSNIYEMN